MKVLLILSDGMRPDSLTGIPFIEELKQKGTYALDAQTVMPSVTLPCHMSLFHSVDPDRHGVTTNTYTPQVRPINGICEQVKQAGKTSAIFYNWEEIRDLARPGSNIRNAEFFSGRIYGYERANAYLCDRAKALLCSDDAPDFTFLYLGWCDGAGHDNGWMSEEYMRSVRGTIGMVEDLVKALPEDFAVILTADHGGHNRSHGSDCAEDMTIPVFFCGEPFAAGQTVENLTIKDIAPTVMKLLGGENAPEWEGRSIL